MWAARPATPVTTWVSSLRFVDRTAVFYPISGNGAISLASALRRNCSPTARQRGAVERENGQLKNEWALLPLRVRGLERVQLHADLTVLAKLACTLARARAVSLAA